MGDGPPTYDEWETIDTVLRNWSPEGLERAACVGVRADVTRAIHSALNGGDRADIPIPFDGPGPQCDYFTTVPQQAQDAPPPYASNARVARVAEPAPRRSSNVEDGQPPAYEPASQEAAPNEAVGHPQEYQLPPYEPLAADVEEIPPPPPDDPSPVDAGAAGQLRRPEVSPFQRRQFLKQQLVGALFKGGNIESLMDNVQSEWRAAPNVSEFSEQALGLRNDIAEMAQGRQPFSSEALATFVRRIASWSDLTEGQRFEFLNSVLKAPFDRFTPRNRLPSCPPHFAAAVLTGILSSDAQPKEKRRLIANFGVTPTAAIEALEEINRPRRLAMATELSNAQKRLQDHEALLDSPTGVVLRNGELPPGSGLRAWSTLPHDMMLCASKKELPGQRDHLAQVEGSFDDDRHFYEIPVANLKIPSFFEGRRNKAA